MMRKIFALSVLLTVNLALIQAAFGGNELVKQPPAEDKHIPMKPYSTIYKDLEKIVKACITTGDVKIKAEGPSTKTIDFSPEILFAGDCHSDNISVVVRADGTGTLKSVSSTNRTWSGDHWWWSIEALDAEKVKIWSVGFRKGPKMGTNERVHNNFDFTFDKNLFEKTKFIRLYYKC